MAVAKIKVLVVDDSSFMRKLILEMLSTESYIEVVGEAKDGNEAIELTGKYLPHVITMDYNMPGMNGAETTAKILQGQEHQPSIIMLSVSTKEGTDETLKSLRAGAVDFISKPSSELSADIDKIKDELLVKIKVAAEAHIQRSSQFDKRILALAKKNKYASRVVVIGASTGGPPVLEDILVGLPADLKIAILVVQHMPEKFTKNFAERLDNIIAFNTKEAEEGDMVKTGICLIAPGGKHMIVEIKDEDDELETEKIIHLTKEPPIMGLRPSIDITMKTVAHCFGDKTIGIILTGMGKDGTEGISAIKKVGGYSIVQSPETTVVDSMPKSIVKQGLADEILNPAEITKKIIELSKQ
jgi:two-component system chemotaxis response regulator CheB